MRYLKTKKIFETRIDSFNHRFMDQLTDKELSFLKSRTGLDLTKYDFFKEDQEYYYIDEDFRVMGQAERMMCKFESLVDLSDWLILQDPRVRSSLTKEQIKEYETS